MRSLLAVLIVLFPTLAGAEEGLNGRDFTLHWVGFASIGLFIVAYAFVIAEEWTGLRKSIPVLLAAGFIWTLIGWQYALIGDTTTASTFVRHSLLEYAELLLFLLVAMTFVNTLSEREVFSSLRGWLVSQGFSLRTIFWLTGLLAFVMSPLADNMTTALVLSSVAMTVGRGNTPFVSLACINIVVAANAGGAFSPFGDITTLMVWQKGLLTAPEFLVLFLPSLVNWLVPACIMSLAIPAGKPPTLDATVAVKRGGYVIILMFIATVAITVTMHSAFHLPPSLGMMGGLGLLKLYGWFLSRVERRELEFITHDGFSPTDRDEATERGSKPFNSFQQVARAEWDTLLFFYGIIMCVGGLGTLGYLSAGSVWLYEGLGATTANILVGLVSAVLDNIPAMYAVLTMNPDMSDGQWLLVTLTAGVGGSLLSVGSAAGVAVMGQAHGIYTFFSHLRWSWAIGLGFGASIWVHFLLNSAYFAEGCC